MLLFSEVIWIFSYTYFLVTGTVNDDLTLLSTSILILGLAGLEFSIGLILIVLFKNTFKTIVFKKKNWNLQQNNKKLSMRKYQWKS